jgi:hypothetical protein
VLDQIESDASETIDAALTIVAEGGDQLLIKSLHAQELQRMALAAGSIRPKVKAA